MQNTEPETFYPANRKKWRQWLQKNHDRKTAIWVLFYKKSTGKPTVTWSDAVDEALCFGWIDSTRRTIDEECFIQFFTRRKAKSLWSKINKDKVKRLTEEGLMQAAGLAAVAIAKKNGSWKALNAVERLHIPSDLMHAFKTQPNAKSFFSKCSRSLKKQILHWITFAKREDTRKKRIAELVLLAAKQQLPKQFNT